MSLQLRAGNAAAAIDVQAGGRLASLRVGGRELLLQTPRTEFVLPSATWGCFLMAPFAGRLSDGVVAYRNRELRVPRNFPPHAIHGAVFDVPWQVERVQESAAWLTCEMAPERWPLGGHVRQHFSLEPDSLELSVEITANDEAMPVALGWHPWFRYRDGDVRVWVQSDHVLETGPDLIPTGRRLAVDRLTDLRVGVLLEGRSLDHTYTHATSPAVVRWPDLEIQIAFDPPVSTVVVHSPAPGFCVEPQTAWPDAFRLEAEGIAGTGLVHLPAGGRFAAVMLWSWRTVG